MNGTRDLSAHVASLRARNPAAGALELLDLVLFEQHVDERLIQHVGDPASALGQEIAAAFDTAMSPGDWEAYAGDGADCYIKAALLRVWNEEVLPRFATRYGLALSPAG